MKVIIGILIFPLCLSIHTQACDCVMYPIEQSLDTEYIFTGKIIEILDSSQTFDSSLNYWKKNAPEEYGWRAKVQVVKKIKSGIYKTDTLEFAPLDDISNCDPLFKLGESYLFFAYKTDQGKFRMAQCTYWGKLENAEENIRKLEAELRRVNRRTNRF